MMGLFSTIKTLKAPEDRLAKKAAKPYFRDALQTEISQLQFTPSQLQYAIFNYLPNWVNGLMSVRNRLVKVFGFDVGADNMRPKSPELNIGEKAGFLTVIEKTENEIISYAEDKHMAFYLSVKKQANKVIVSSLVNQKTTIGRVYVNAILPFHYLIARIVITNALKAGRI